MVTAVGLFTLRYYLPKENAEEFWKEKRLLKIIDGFCKDGDSGGINHFRSINSLSRKEKRRSLNDSF